MAAQPPSPPTSRRPRGATVSQAEVRTAADELLRDGERPSVEAVRRKLGERGSPNRIAPMLADWFRDLGARVQRGPGAFERIPAPAAHILETLWLALADEAQRRASASDAVAQRAQLELRGRLLSQRETELTDRLRDRESLTSALEARAADLDRQLARVLSDLRACRDRLTEMTSERDRLLKRLASPRPRVERAKARLAARPAQVRVATPRKAKVPPKKSVVRSTSPRAKPRSSVKKTPTPRRPSAVQAPVASRRPRRG